METGFLKELSVWKRCSQAEREKNLETSQRASTHTFGWHNYMIDVINYFGLCKREFRVEIR